MALLLQLSSWLWHIAFAQLGPIRLCIKAFLSKLWSSAKLCVKYCWWIPRTTLDKVAEKYSRLYREFIELVSTRVLVLNLVIVYTIYLVIIGITLFIHIIARFAYRRFVALWRGQDKIDKLEEKSGDSSEETSEGRAEDKSPSSELREAEEKSGLPETIRDKIEAIKTEGGEEAELLHLVVDPCTVDHGWSDIALDREVEEVIKLITSKGNKSEDSDYGVLKGGKIAGALLYGPPGTGKTHLARVLARESAAVVINASPADIEDCWVGKTEKTIKALFSLGRKLAPSIIFIDEADALLRKRKFHDWGWERTRINQFLQEMDELRKSKDAPFVLLSSNFPCELDPGVLRRVPTRLHIALPSRQLRKAIFDINLKDEILDRDVDTMYLAERTPGYSGSDIRTLCIQAALACDIIITQGDDAGKRILNRAHFTKALARTPPSTSASALEQIEEFSRELDPEAIISRQIQHVEVEAAAVGESGANERICFLHGKQPAPRPMSSASQQDYSHATAYQYQPLHDKDHEVRLLHLMPGDFDDPILIQLTHSSLKSLRKNKAANSPLIIDSIKATLPPHWRVVFTNENRIMFFKTESNELVTSWQHPDPSFDMSSVYLPPSTDRDGSRRGPSFEALSYVWGSTEASERAYEISDTSAPKVICVTASLSQALRHLRRPRERRTLWVDAVCIDQQDAADVAAQVPRMDTIYRNASRVVVWLGQASEDSDAAMTQLAHLGRQVETVGNILLFPSPDAEDRHISSPCHEIKLEMAVWHAIEALLMRSWFQRVWTMQEIRLADHEALIQCGHATVGWKILVRALRCLNNKEQLALQTLKSRMRPVFDLAPVMAEASVRSTMFMASTRGCFDPRDRVYGVLGLLPAHMRRRVSPRYDLPVIDVYRDAFIAHTETVGRLELLGFSYPEGRKLPGPSWVPDWTSRLRITYGISQFATGASRCHAALRSKEKEMLDTLGVICATVTGVKRHALHGRKAGDEKPVHQLVEALLDWEPQESVMDDEQPYVTGDRSAFDAYAMAVCKGMLMERFHTTPYGASDYPSMAAWKTFLRCLRARQLDGANISQRWLFHIFDGLLETSWVETREGYFGLAPGGTRLGDVICILLGCDVPLLLRLSQKERNREGGDDTKLDAEEAEDPEDEMKNAIENGIEEEQGDEGNEVEDDTYQVVGECVIPGLEDSIRLLGPLPRPWVVKVTHGTADEDVVCYQNTETGDITDNDPRLTAPTGDGQWEWEPLQGDEMASSSTGSDDDPPFTGQRFRHKATGQVVGYDPRLEPEAIEARGVRLKTLTLV
ncbi:hypothetical protein F4803DRAFT_557643 [Xylaria telfairii]|nr:hypothetical protein F4803DRAFT_557643 [Xylaria telfairii]